MQPGTFARAIALNVLDCVANPRELLVSLASVLRTGGKISLTCPYDWSPGATPVEAWLGGHSERSDSNGAPEKVLRSLLTPVALGQTNHVLLFRGGHCPQSGPSPVRQQWL